MDTDAGKHHFRILPLALIRINLGKEVATHSSTLAWKNRRMEEPGRLQSMGSQRVRHDWVTSLYFLSFTSTHSLAISTGMPQTKQLAWKGCRRTYQQASCLKTLETTTSLELSTVHQRAQNIALDTSVSSLAPEPLRPFRKMSGFGSAYQQNIISFRTCQGPAEKKPGTQSYISVGSY